MSYPFRNISALFLSVLVIGLIGCKSTEKSVSGDESPSMTDNRSERASASQMQQMLNNTRNKLSDVYASQMHDMPAAFLKADSSVNQINRNPYDGFRVQILSTRNVSHADSVANAFRVWADTTIAGYQPKVHQSFRQPHFRVHIGDFQQREKANSFSRLIKDKFPDAWVVHDRIEPSNVPADTASFSFVEDDTTAAERNEF